MQTIHENTKVQQSSGVISRVVDDETILVLPREGQVKVVNEIGGLVWQSAEEGITLSEIVERIVSEYEVDLQTAVQDTRDYISELVGLGVLKII